MSNLVPDDAQRSPVLGGTPRGERLGPFTTRLPVGCNGEQTPRLGGSLGKSEKGIPRLYRGLGGEKKEEGRRGRRINRQLAAGSTTVT